MLQGFGIIDTTLREGEQFAGVHFTSAQKRRIARALDAFGVDYIEVTSPVVSRHSLQDAQSIVRMGLKARILAHVRCHPDDIARLFAPACMASISFSARRYICVAPAMVAAWKRF